MKKISKLQEARYGFEIKLPKVLQGDITNVKLVEGEKTNSIKDQDRIKALFPSTYGLPKIEMAKGENKNIKNSMKVGVILSGGQAPGGHNVISGIYDALKKANKDNELFGFLGGPSGLTDDKYIIMNDSVINEYRNTGGFDIIGSGRTKLETKDQFEKVEKVCKKHGITGLIIIGGDDSNTNAAVLAEYFASNNSGISVVGCPKTIDGDLKNEFIEVSFGFDTATKTYSELISNIARDANSAKKYWHFIKLMGRSASHIALECALQTQVNISLISEEIEKNNTSLGEIADYISDVVIRRSKNGNNFGLVLIPEGLIEFIPAIKKLIAKINDLLACKKCDTDLVTYIKKNLDKELLSTFNDLEIIQDQLLMDRDPHGNVQVSKIETEKLLAYLVEQRINKKVPFNSQCHFFGYEGRAAFPSNFDSTYCYSLGYNAVLLLNSKKTGYISSVRNLDKDSSDWTCGGIPITMMMNMERRHGEDKSVIQKALVDLEGKPFKYFAENRKTWEDNTCYIYTGAIQYYGPKEVCDATTVTLQLERN